MRRAVYLDRDGVLNRAFVRDGTPHPPSDLAEMEILPGVENGLSLLRAEGYVLLVVTNQPDVARGTQSREKVVAINEYLRSRLPLDGVYVCFHDNPDGCACRKPAPGMILRGAREYEIDLRQSYMVGDRASDIAAGQAAGCRTCLIETPYSRCDLLQPTFHAADLKNAAEKIVKYGES